MLNMKKFVFSFIIFLFLLILNRAELRTNHDTKQYCLVKSYKYSNEFLYSSKYGDHKFYVNVPNKKRLSSLNQLKWIFEPIDAISKGYYIKSVVYDEYLCAKNSHDNLFKSIRVISLMPFKADGSIFNSKCVWIVNDIKNDKYTIKNFYYKELLFTSMSILQSFFTGRKIHTWINSAKGLISYFPPSEDQFVWYIYCSRASGFRWH
jgi:hypothetical protein